MIGEMEIALTEFVTDHLGEAMIGQDLRVRTGERGAVLIMGTVVAVAQVHIAESEQVLTILVGVARAPIGRKGGAPIGR